MQFFSTHEFISLVYAFLGGILPTLVWLFFWNREDQKNPEPKRMILLAFIGGTFAVFISLYFEKIVFNLDQNILFSGILKPILLWFKNFSILENIPLNKLLLVVLFAPIIEELAKFLMAYGFALRSRNDDEPIDPMIYMITTALGFAAVENTLFLIEPITKNSYIFGIITGNMRFIGATLLHTVSSATIGMFISFNFFDKKLHKFIFIVLGITCAILVHSIFNFFMIGDDQSSFIALELIWVAVIIVLLAFEKIKRVKLEKIQ